jgi:hypothetical protein
MLTRDAMTCDKNFLFDLNREISYKLDASVSFTMVLKHLLNFNEIQRGNIKEMLVYLGWQKRRCRFKPEPLG